MSNREPNRRYHWRSFNPIYGPWYRLVKADTKPIVGAEVVVQPDMDRERWFWYVRIGTKKAPRMVKTGRAPTLEDAKFAAREIFDSEY